MRNTPKQFKNNKETVENIPYCRKVDNCRDQLIASVALKNIGKYIKRVKFNGGRI